MTHRDLRRTNFFTAEEVGEIFKIPTRAVHHLARTGQIPGFKVGRIWRFYEEEIFDWIDEKYFRRANPDIEISDPDILAIRRKAQEILKGTK
jgi:excisionase family DNA binding protein